MKDLMTEVLQNIYYNNKDKYHPVCAMEACKGMEI
jgi:hypothetical protein